jgi:hypothetical protein
VLVERAVFSKGSGLRHMADVCVPFIILQLQLPVSLGRNRI